MWSNEKWKNSIQRNKMSDSGITRIPMLKLIVSSKEEEVSYTCYPGLINSEVILHWFNVGTSINQDIYLEMLHIVI